MMFHALDDAALFRVWYALPTTVYPQELEKVGVVCVMLAFMPF